MRLLRLLFRASDEAFATTRRCDRRLVQQHGPRTQPIKPDGMRGEYDPRWYEVGGEEFGKLAEPDV